MMNHGHKRKGRWGYGSLFGSRAVSKVIVLDGLYEAANTPGSLARTNSRNHSKSGPVARIRRGGSKVLYKLGLRSNKGSRADSSSSAVSDLDVAIALVRDVRDAATPAVAAEVPKNSRNGLTPLKIPTSQRVVTPITVDAVPFQIPFAATPKAIHPFIDETEKPSEEGQQFRIISLDIPVKRKNAGGLRQSRSMPGLAHQLSHKLSSTFGNPTIVHRPNMRSRPSLSSMRETPGVLMNAAIQEASPNPDTDPSSYNYSGSVSPADLSTAKTSLESNITSLLSKIKEQSEEPNPNPKPAHVFAHDSVVREQPEKPLTPIQENAIMIKPTILTVESTANAKIFFETHFNSILSGQASPRSLRRHELEVQLQSNALSAEDRYRERCVWASQESEYLRQSRVLKGKSHHMVGSKGVSVAGYEVVRILGKGSFGVVRLVREKSLSEDGQIVKVKTRNSRSSDETEKRKRNVYAMKVIRKSDMLRNSQEGHLRAERDFLVASEKSRWVVPLIASFQDTTNLYLVMEYMIGGDLLGLLIRYGQLKEKRTRWYIAEMVLCIEEAHRLRWIHRDVKPDNFLITASGHLKISDFGLAFDGHWAHDQSYFNNHRYSLLEKLGINIEGDSLDRSDSTKTAAGKKLANILMGGKESRNARDRHELPSDEERGGNESVLQWRNRHGKRRLARSVVGTSQYMAPEVIRGELYDGRCDWWSIGIIMFECLYGWTPFVGEDRQDTKNRILHHQKEFRFPLTSSTEKKYKVSHEAKDLINRMLQEKEHRLCSKKYLVNDYEEEKRSHARLGTTTPKHQSRDFQGNFVFPDDATDIKTHPFFQGIPWDRLHLTKAPEIPDVKSCYDTKYFDEDEPVSDVDDASSTSSLQEQVLKAQEEYEGEIAAAFAANANQQDVTDVAKNMENIILAETTKMTLANAVGDAVVLGKKSARAKEKRRPRDRILRDTKVAKQVLDIRKKGAFLGYTYRRPRPVLASAENGRFLTESLSRRLKVSSIN